MLLKGIERDFPMRLLSGLKSFEKDSKGPKGVKSFKRVVQMLGLVVDGQTEGKPK